MTKSKKRKEPSTSGPDNGAQKRPRPQGDKPTSKFYDAQPVPDAATGLRSFFPGVDGNLNDSDLEGDPNDGLEYLRRVRYVSFLALFLNISNCVGRVTLPGSPNLCAVAPLYPNIPN
jgi:hypothetical protein